MNPKVSIVIPVYNVAPYLRECLDSVLAQSLTEIEILCGDGGSTDGSLEILHEYAERDARIQIISKQGSGYGQSMNDCIAIARGEYIGIVESDDTITPDMYQALYERAVQDKLDWVRGDIYFSFSDKCEKKNLRYEKIIIGNFYNKVLNPQCNVRPWRSRMRTWSGIYNREFLLNNNILHNETPGGSYQDIGFYLKTLYFAQRVEFVPQGFYIWRQDNPNSTIHYDGTKLANKVIDEWKLNQEHLDNLPQARAWERAGFQYRKYSSYMWAIEQLNGTEKEALKRIAIQELAISFHKQEIKRAYFRPIEWYEFRVLLAKEKSPDEQWLLLRKLKYRLKSFGFVREVNEWIKQISSAMKRKA